MKMNHGKGFVKSKTYVVLPFRKYNRKAGFLAF
jgi:hypothetical protein